MHDGFGEKTRCHAAGAAPGHRARSAARSTRSWSPVYRRLALAAGPAGLMSVFTGIIFLLAGLIVLIGCATRFARS